MKTCVIVKKPLPYSLIQFPTHDALTFSKNEDGTKGALCPFKFLEIGVTEGEFEENRELTDIIDIFNTAGGIEAIWWYCQFA